MLREAECVLAEETRRTSHPLKHHGWRRHSLAACTHQREPHRDAGRGAAGGKRFALFTDGRHAAGERPGQRAGACRGGARRAGRGDPRRERGDGALCVAGVAADHFRFVAFLPRSGKRRREALRVIAEDRLTSVLFEAPTRLVDTLVDLRKACGATRRAAVCRELTKLHEEVARGSLAELCERFSETPRGELTLVIEGAREPAVGQDDEDEGVVASPVPLDADALMDARSRGLGA